MNIFTYAVFSYALMAVISFAVVGVIVLLNKLLSRSGKEKGEHD